MGRASRFTEEYKREAVRQAESSGNVSQTARNLGMSALMIGLSRWNKAEAGFKKRQSSQVERSHSPTGASFVSQPKKSDF
jgi:transposase-like protein